MYTTPGLHGLGIRFLLESVQAIKLELHFSWDSVSYTVMKMFMWALSVSLFMVYAPLNTALPLSLSSFGN